MRKLGNICAFMFALALCGLFAAGNVLTVLLCGGIAIVMGYLAHVLRGAE